jgi:hypothetical protein
VTGAVRLGPVDPARSRHGGRRSAVALADAGPVVGTADGRVRAFDPTLDERWATDPGDAAVVAATPVAGGVAVGERGPRGAVALYGPGGDRRWRHETAADLGAPTAESRARLPFVVALATGSDGRLYAAARRSDHDAAAGRRFESRVYALASDGTVAWSRAAPAAPAALSVRDDRIAVAYNRRTDGGPGLVVHDRTGAVRWTWDPPGGGERRVGDAALLPDGVAVASHADHRGYRLGPGGTVRWRVDLGVERSVDGERVYAYPTHAATPGDAVAFVTGNTYPVEGRETAARHPGEHTVSVHAPGGERRLAASIGGFAGAVATDGGRIVVPGAQHLRDRDAAGHGLWVVGADGSERTVETEGIVTAVAAADGRIAAVEEPVVYHDEGVERGAYRLFVP